MASKSKNGREPRKPRQRSTSSAKGALAHAPAECRNPAESVGVQRTACPHGIVAETSIALVGTGIVRPGIFSMMVLIDENPGIAQIQIAVQLGIDKATLVGLIRLLQKQGWIERRPSRADRRRQDLYLTVPGRQELASTAA